MALSDDSTRSPHDSGRTSRSRTNFKTLAVDDNCADAFDEYRRGLERVAFEEQHELRHVTRTEALKRLLETPEAIRVRRLLPRRALG